MQIAKDGIRFVTSGMKECKLPWTITSHPCDHGIYNFHVENGFKFVIRARALLSNHKLEKLNAMPSLFTA